MSIILLRQHRKNFVKDYTEVHQTFFHKYPLSLVGSV